MRFLIVVLLLVIGNLSFAQNVKIRSVYYYSDEDSLHGWVDRDEYYNEKGKMLSSIEFDRDGKETRRTIYSYMDTLLLKKVEVSQQGRDSCLYTFQYDGKARLIRTAIIIYTHKYIEGYGIASTKGCVVAEDEPRYYGWQPSYQVSYSKYDRDNLLIVDSGQTCCISQRGFITCKQDYRTSYVYDNAKKPYRQIYEDYRNFEENGLTDSTLFDYNRFANLEIVTRKWKNMGSLIDSVLYANGNVIEKIRYRKTEDEYYLQDKINYIYNSSGELVRKITREYLNGSLYRKETECYRYK